jgi:hypothetical protein
MQGLTKRMQEDGIWVQLNDACMQDVHWHESVSIKMIDHILHARLIDREEIYAIANLLAEDTRWFHDQVRQHGWWHDAYALWTEQTPSL